jgi:hypothetical protein
MHSIIQKIFFTTPAKQPHHSNKEMLYNLLFDGRISLKEYLAAIEKLT